MSASPMYNVVVRKLEVGIERVEPGIGGYETAGEDIILRERDALELHRKMTRTGLPEDGKWSFASLETAKSFALLQLKTIEQHVEDNLDRVQEFEG